MASELETKIRKAAEDFAHSVLGTLKSMTLAEIAELVQGGAATAAHVEAKHVVRAKPAAKKTPAKKVVSAKEAAPAKKAATKKLKLSPARAAALKVQGTYIGLLRSLSVAEKARIKGISARKGMPAAIAAMRKK
jgi:hypothetical protein